MGRALKEREENNAMRNMSKCKSEMMDKDLAREEHDKEHDKEHDNYKPKEKTTDTKDTATAAGVSRERRQSRADRAGGVGVGVLRCKSPQLSSSTPSLPSSNKKQPPQQQRQQQQQQQQSTTGDDSSTVGDGDSDIGVDVPYKPLRMNKKPRLMNPAVQGLSRSVGSVHSEVSVEICVYVLMYEAYTDRERQREQRGKGRLDSLAQYFSLTQFLSIELNIFRLFLCVSISDSPNVLYMSPYLCVSKCSLYVSIPLCLQMFSICLHTSVSSLCLSASSIFLCM